LKDCLPGVERWQLSMNPSAALSMKKPHPEKWRKSGENLEKLGFRHRMGERYNKMIEMNTFGLSTG